MRSNMFCSMALGEKGPALDIEHTKTSKPISSPRSMLPSPIATRPTTP